MTSANPSAGLEAAFLENREKLLRFLRARGAGDGAEDIVQEIWLRIAGGRTGPVTAPLSYLFRTADLLMIDRYRSTTRAAAREKDWVEANTGHPAGGAHEASPEQRVAAAREAAQVLAMLEALGPRPAAVFRRHRLDGVTQREVAAEFGISLSTVESDLRAAYAALVQWKERTQ